MRRLPLSVVLLVVASCGGKITCTTNKNLNLDKVKEHVSSILETKHGVKPSSVDCPGPVKPEKDATFQCTVGFEKLQGTVNLVQTSDEGTARITSVYGVVFGASVEKAITDEFRKQVNRNLEVACGPRVRPSTPGAVFTCDGKDANGATGKIQVTIEDDKASVHWKLLPTESAPAAPAPAAAAPGTP